MNKYIETERYSLDAYDDTQPEIREEQGTMNSEKKPHTRSGLS